MPGRSSSSRDPSAGEGAPPELLPGRSTRYFAARAYVCLLASGSISIVMAPILYLTRSTGLGYAFLVPVLSLAGLALRYVVFWSKREKVEAAAGYRTLSVGSPRLWELDATTGAVITAPSVVLVDEDYAGTLSKRVWRRSDWHKSVHRAKVRAVIFVGAFTLVVAPLVLMLRNAYVSGA